MRNNNAGYSIAYQPKSIENPSCASQYTLYPPDRRAGMREAGASLRKLAPRYFILNYGRPVLRDLPICTEDTLYGSGNTRAIQPWLFELLTFT